VLTIHNPYSARINKSAKTETSGLFKFLMLASKVLILLSICYLCYLKLWTGLICGAVYLMFFFRKQLSFFIYVLTMDFTLDEELNNDLDEI